ncbi:MAG: DUF4261 domain-containing protein [Candidatus Sumerlaeia bacterium]
MAEGSTDNKLPYQMDVYFDSFPTLDADRMAAFINSIDPGEDPCEITRPSEETIQEWQSGEKIKLDGFVASLGDFNMLILVHSVPSPAAEAIQDSNLPPDQKARLGAHKAFALLNNTGGDKYRGYESLIFLYKVAMAMCEQGALGVGNIHTDHFFHREILMQMLEIKNNPGPDGKNHTLWDVMRHFAEPRQLLMNITRFKDAAGGDWAATRGFSFCGFPDFICPMDGKMKPDEICDVFNMLFSYLMENGPVIAAGHTIGPDERHAYRFSEPPAGVELPYPAVTVLAIDKEQKKKRFIFF